MRWICLLSIFCTNFLFAQRAEPPTLELRTGKVTLALPAPGTGPIPLERTERSAARVHRFVVFSQTLTAAERAKLEAQGIRFLEPLRPHGWLVALPANCSRAVLREAGVLGMAPVALEHKLDPRLREVFSGRGWRRNAHALLVLPWADDTGALQRMPHFGELPFTPFGAEGGRILQLNGRELKRLLTAPAIRWVEPAPTDGEPEDRRGQTYHRINPILPVPGGAPGLDGTGVTVVVNDDGYVGPHIDFKGRTEQGGVAGDLLGDHGDMVAGIVAAAGNLDPRQPGMAPGADLVIRQYQGSLPNTLTLYQNAGAVIFNSSYSDGCNGGYTSVTRLVDMEIVDNPAIIQVFSAGNNGTQDCGYGAGTGWGNITGGHKIAKNCIATANLTDNDLVVASSSRGPSADGRLKPDISAYGQGQISNGPDNTYAPGGGTSAASPGVAGTLALLYQGWRQLHGGDPASGLMKALLLNTADDVGNIGPDYIFGWGRLNASRAWQAIVDGRHTTGSVDQGQQQQHTIEVPNGVGELRVMLYWMDPAASVSAPAALVNDLDLSGADPALTVHQPWELPATPMASVLATPAFRGVDRSNNVEQVAVLAPQPGTWTFTVAGFDVPQGPQTYFLVYEFMQEGPAITFPLAGEVLAADEMHRFRWEALPGASAFNLDLSLDGGATWSPLPIATAERRHQDLNFGAVVVDSAYFRVERDGHTATSGPFIVMPVATNLQVTFNCPDSAGLVWDPVANASGYILHQLGAQFMDSVGFTTSTSFTFQGLQPVHDDWFAVTAIAPNGERTRRSLALARPQALVACMAERDLGVSSLVSPGPLVVNCQPAPQVLAMVRNMGLQTVNSFTAGFRANNATPATQSFNQTILPGDSALISFSAPLTGVVPGTTNTLRIWATAVNESFPPNDTLTITFVSAVNPATLPYFNDLEGMATCNINPVCAQACTLGDGLLNGVNGLDDDIDWRVDTAGTSTANTGPAADHTLGNAFGRYLYMEASGNCFGRVAHLYTPCVTLPGPGSYALGFWYHQYGSTQGELHVDLIVNGVVQEDIVPPVIGDQGDQWRQGTVDLTPFAGQTVTGRFRGITGTAHYSDIALDDIGFWPFTGVADHGTAPLRVTPTEQDGVFLLHAEQPIAADGRLHVFDATGRLVRTTPVQGMQQVRIDLSQAAPGLFVVHLSTGAETRHALVVRP
ncbi:MAG: S8 family serine peptidase [Flavobacteriales bacterium]|nr:S8 family serine peptidase [Flavobacteriales bacterium]